MAYTGNRRLTNDEMKQNAREIASYFLAKGYSLNAISAMLGNWQSESRCNPGAWQSYVAGNYSAGYGLAQWTPARNYINWCSKKGYKKGAMETAFKRIDYELKNHLQFYHPSMSFNEFLHSNDSPYNLAIIFLNHYERPADRNQPFRGTQAEYWKKFIVKEGIMADPDVNPDEDIGEPDDTDMIAHGTKRGYAKSKLIFYQQRKVYII